MQSGINRRTFLKLLGLLPIAYLPGAQLDTRAPGASGQLDTPNVLILVFDTLSAQHLSLHGYPRNTTPNLKRFADRATVYHAHYAAGNFTTPGTASLLTGTYPWSHRACHMHGIPLAEFAQKNLFRLLPPHMFVAGYTHNLLAHSLLRHFAGGFDRLLRPRDLALADSQYSDLAFARDYNASIWSERLIMRGEGGKASSLFLSPLYRTLRRATKRDLEQDYLRLFPKGVPGLDDLYFLLEETIDWIGEQLVTLPRPFLGYFHVLPPHEPYRPRWDFVDLFQDDYQPPPKPERFFTQGHSQKELNQQRRDYDEYLAYTDAEFGRLLDFMERQGVLENTYVFVTSDHGEMFERGVRGHVTSALYEPLLRVPLLVAKPGQKQREDVLAPTSCVDLLPTILSLTGQPVPAWCEGAILPSFDGSPAGSNRSIYAVEAKRNPVQAPLTHASLAVIHGRHKLISYVGYENAPEVYELYDLHNDPEELEDLFPSHAALAGELRGELHDQLAQAGASA